MKQDNRQWPNLHHHNGYVNENIKVNPDGVLIGAVNQLEEVVVMGRDKETGKIYVASSTANVAELLGLIEVGKSFIHKNCL